MEMASNAAFPKPRRQTSPCLRKEDPSREHDSVEESAPRLPPHMPTTGSSPFVPPPLLTLARPIDWR